MTTTTSSSDNRRFWNLYWQIIKRNKGVLFLSNFCMFLVFPLPFLFQMLQNRKRVFRELSPRMLNGISHIYTDLTTVCLFVILIGFPLLVAGMLFRYLHDKKAADVYGALPITRGRILGANWLAGTTILSVPYLLSFLWVALFSAVFRYPYFNLGLMFVDLGVTLVMLQASFAIAVFCSIQAGTTFDSVFFASVLHIGPAIVLSTLPSFWEVFAYSFSWTYSNFDPHWGALLPYVTYIMEGGRLAFWICFWAVLTGVLAFCSLKLYQRRKSELSGNLMLHKSRLKGFVTLLIVWICSILFGAIFANALPSDTILGEKLAYLLGTAVGAVVSCLVVEAILARGFSTMRRSYKRMGILAGGVTIVTALIITVGAGFAERWIPSLESIESITLNSYNYNGNSIYLDQSTAYTYTLRENENITDFVNDRRGGTRSYNHYPTTWGAQFSDTEQIAYLLELCHKNVQARQQEAGFLGLKQPAEYENLSFVGRAIFRLKSGRTITRYYNWAEPETAELLDKWRFSQGYLRSTSPLFLNQAEQIDEAALWDGLLTEKYALQLSDVQKEELLDAMRQDLLQRDWGAYLAGQQQTLGYVTLLMNPPSPDQSSGRFFTGSAELEILPDSKNVLDLLEKWGLTEHLQTNPDRITQVAYTNVRYSLSSQNLFDRYRLIRASDVTSNDILYEGSIFQKMDLADGKALLTDVRTIALSAQIGEQAAVIPSGIVIPEDNLTILFFYTDELGESSVTQRFLPLSKLPEKYRNSLQQEYEDILQ